MPKCNRCSAKDSQQVPTLHKASSKNKLKKGKKWNYLESAAHNSKKNSKDKPVRHKKSNNSKTKSGRHNKWPQLKSITNALAKDNKSKPAAPKKSNSYKANLNRHRKHPQPESVANTLTENSNSKPVVHKRQLAKKKHNPSAHEPTSVNNSNTREIATNNGKSPQPITKPKNTHQPDNVINNPTAASPTINTL